MPMDNKLLRPRASGFNPASIAGIVHWWDANDASTLTLNAGAVETWTSKAGTKTAATQTVANNRPVTTTLANGKTAIQFDGSNDGFNFTGVSRTDETWILAVAQTADQTGTRAFINDGGNGDGINFARGSVKLVDTSWGGGTDGVHRIRAQYAANPATNVGPAVISVVRSTAGGGFLFIDGTQRVSSINGASSFTTSGAVTIQRIGYYSSTLFQLNGWIGEILCWNRPLAAADRNKVEKYLGKKWGITVA